MEHGDGDLFRPPCVSLDLEVGRDDRIHAFGAIRADTGRSLTHSDGGLAALLARLDDALRTGRMPEANKATLKQMLRAEVDAALSQRPDLEVIKLADGARDNWSFLDELAPQAAGSVTLVDFLHADEQLRAAVDMAYGVFHGHPAHALGPARPRPRAVHGSRRAE